MTIKNLLSDDAAVDWHLNWRAAFGGNPAALIDTITPILRGRSPTVSLTPR